MRRFEPFTVALAVLALLTGVRVVADPTASPVAISWGRPLSLVWGSCYAFGGVLILWGMGRRQGRWEAAGCVLFAGGAFTNALATLGLLEASRFLTWYSVATLVVFGSAGTWRARRLMRGERALWIKDTIKDGP